MVRQRPWFKGVASAAALAVALMVLGMSPVSAAFTPTKAAIRKIAVKVAKKQIKKAAPNLSVKNAENLGGAPASDYQEGILWALVQADGTIVAQSGGITMTGAAGGAYFINFGEPVSGRAILATQHYDETGGIGDGEIIAAPCGATAPGAGPFPLVFRTNPAANNTSHVYVETSNSDGTAAPSPFYAAVIA